MTQERRADAAFAIAILAGVLFIAFLGPLGRRLEMVHQNDFSVFLSGLEESKDAAQAAS